MEKKIYVLSSRSIDKYPAFSFVIEFEDVIVNSLDAKLIISGEKFDSTNSILFLVAMSIHSLVELLKNVDASKPSAIYGYIIDSFITHQDQSKFRKSISSHHRSVRKLHHLFVPFRESVDDFNALYDIPISYVPYAVDVINKGGYDPYKIIDVNGYGRQPFKLSQLLSERFNQRYFNRVYHYTNHTSLGDVHDFYGYRQLFWQLLRKSKISLVFDVLHTSLESKPLTFSFVPGRLYESLAAGCVVVGKRPQCQDMDELFNWPNAFIELPDELFGMFDSIEYILQNYDLEAIGRRNHEECLTRHDWRHRLIDIMNIVNLPHLSAKVETSINNSVLSNPFGKIES